MNVSLIVCTYNRAALLETMLESAARVHVPEGVTWKVLVVDNNSTDGTRQVVERLASRLPCCYLAEPRQGKSFALNTGIGRASGEIVAFTDDDVTLDPGWLEGVARAFASPGCFGIGGRILPVWPGPKPSWYVDAGPYRLMMGVIVRYDHGDVAREIEMLPFGANMAFRREAFTRYGGFRTDLGPVGGRMMLGEDSEFCHRIRAGGEHIFYVPDAVAYHPVPPARMRKAYFLSWYYRRGLFDVAAEPVPAGTVRWLGVPRWLFRDLAREAWRWLVTLDGPRRFHHKATSYREVGRIVGHYHQARASRRSEP